MDEKKILLADDDGDDRELFCEALSNVDRHISCSSFVNGSDLFGMLHKLDDLPELIFLDLNMPVMNGWECLKRLKEEERFKSMPVVMISTSSHSNEIDQAARLGAFCYFVKPNNFNVLTKSLRYIVDKSLNGLNNVSGTLHADIQPYIFFLSK